MPKTIVETLDLSSLTEKFFVREKLDQGRVDMFAKHYEARADIPLLGVGRLKGDDTETSYLVDGRHRKAGLRKLGRAKAECEITIYDSIADMIAAALEANWGGSLPPTEGDLRRTVRILLEQNEGRNKIYARLAFVPRDILRKMVAEAEREILATQMLKAREAVANGMTVADAAAEFGVNKGKLQRQLAGKSQPKVSAPGQIRLKISNRFKALGPSLTKTLLEVARMYESAELKQKDCEGIYEHVRQLMENCSNSIDEAEKRFKALPGIKAPQHR